MMQDRVIGSFVDTMKNYFDDMEVKYCDDRIIVRINKYGMELVRAVSIEAIIMAYDPLALCRQICTEINYAFGPYSNRQTNDSNQ